MQESIENVIHQKKFVIFIIGTTAVGKTNLSLEIAQKFEGEIISADSQQIYKRADIMTGKATKEEQLLAPHHMIDIVDLKEKLFNKKEFSVLALSKIEEIFKRNHIPIVVGGTNNYIEALLFNDDFFSIPQTDAIIKLESYDYKVLLGVDEVMAKKLHPNDKRRIENYLKFYEKTGIKPSDHIKQSSEQLKLNFERTIILWPKMVNRENFAAQVTARIEKMLSYQGICEIYKIFDDCYQPNQVETEENDKEGEPDEEEKKDLDQQITPTNEGKGVLQSIGYKEFKGFFLKLREYIGKGLIDDYKLLEEILAKPDVKQELTSAKAVLLNKTLLYAKKQIKWIKNRLLNNLLLKDSIFHLEYSEYSEFESKVITVGKNIISSMISGEKTVSPAAGGALDVVLKRKPGSDLNKWEKRTCEVCGKTLNGDTEWKTHLKSKAHKHLAKKAHKHKMQLDIV